MIRFFVSATYRTAGGNLGQTAFPLVADTWDNAKQLAARRLSIRGRSRFNITITREA
jgi:hypothetical protein